MPNSDPSVAAIIIKLICVATSIVIGAIMALESQHNAVQRRGLLLAAVREGYPRKFLKHFGAFLLNLVFLWLLQLAIFTLIMTVVGLELDKLLYSLSYILLASIFSLPLIAFVFAGKPIRIRRPPDLS